MRTLTVRTRLLVSIVIAGVLVGSSSVALPRALGATVHHPARLQSLTIMVGGISKQIYLPNELAKNLGYFAKEGIDVQLIDEPSGASSEDAVIAGQVQGGSGAYQHAIQLQALGKNIEEVVQLGIAPGEAEVVAANEASQIKSWKDLKGKKLGVTELGSGTHTLSQFLLQKAGVSIDQATFVPVGAGDTFIAAMQHGSIDAGMTTEPTISRLVQTHVGKVLTDLRVPSKSRKALGADYPFICLFMQTSYVNSHKSTVQKVVNAYVKTLKWIHTHTAAQIAAKLPADYYAGNKALYISSLKAEQAMFSPTGLMPKSGPPFVLNFLRGIDSSVKGASINLSKTFTNTFAQAAQKAK